MYSDEERLTPPVKVGTIINLIVVGFGNNKDPILKVEKYVVFLKVLDGSQLKVGDEVQVKIVKVLPKFGFAEML